MCPGFLWGGGREGPGNPNIGQTQKLAQNIKTLILVDMAKKCWFGQNSFGQNSDLTKVGLAKVGISCLRGFSRGGGVSGGLQGGSPGMSPGGAGGGLLGEGVFRGGGGSPGGSPRVSGKQWEKKKGKGKTMENNGKRRKQRKTLEIKQN